MAGSGLVYGQGRGLALLPGVFNQPWTQRALRPPIGWGNARGGGDVDYRQCHLRVTAESAHPEYSGSLVCGGPGRGLGRLDRRNGAAFLFPAIDLGACYPSSLPLSLSIVPGTQGDNADS